MKSLIIVLTFFVTLSQLVSAGKYSTSPVAGIPSEWVQLKGDEVLGYANYIKSLNLKNIDTYDVLHPHFQEHKGVSNSLPPRHMWKDIPPVLKTIDKLASILGAEVKPFIKAYRSPEFNKSIGGKSKSYYLTNQAVRVGFVGVAPKDVASAARKLRSEGFFNGGVGVYSNSIHIDTRGYQLDW